MRKALFIFLAFIILGCKNFETKKFSVDQIEQEELEQVDWKNLDTYPTFKTCDHYVSRPAKKDCFEKEISKQIYTFLNKKEVELEDSVSIKFRMRILITAKGHPKLDSLSLSKSTKEKLPNLKMWIEEALDSLPKIYPAEKRGIPVAASFKLPISIQTK